MQIHVWGTDFRRMDSAQRSKLYFPSETRKRVLDELLPLGFHDLLYVYTCNRVEFYTTVMDHFYDSHQLWITALEKLLGDGNAYYQGYAFEGKTALRHLIRVASSLESFVVGEPQVLGQLKDAHRWTKEAGLPIQSTLEQSLQLAFAMAKRIRSQTTLGEKSVSIASLAVQHLQSLEDKFPLRKAVVLGRSPMTLFILNWLLKNRPQCPVVWVNRRVETLKNYPESQAAELKSLDEFLNNPGDFSHLFTATASASPILRENFFYLLPHVPVVFDLAEPPDVEARDLDVIRLSNLREEAKANESYRKEAVEAAEHLIEISLKEYYLSVKGTPVLREFSQIEPLFLEELTQACRGMEDWVPEELRAKISEWSEKLVKKNLHLSREHLKKILRELSNPQNFVPDSP